MPTLWDELETEPADQRPAIHDLIDRLHPLDRERSALDQERSDLVNRLTRMIRFGIPAEDPR